MPPSVPVAMPVEPIVDVAAMLLSFPLDPPFRAAVRSFPAVDVVLMQLRTAGGLEGLGYAFAFNREDAVALLHYATSLAPRLVGRNALDVVANWHHLHDGLAFVGAAGAATGALAAMDIASWDILGRAAGLPLYRLLGAARESIATYGSGGSLALDTAALVAEMEGHVAAGHRAVKFKLGHGRGADVARLAAVRASVGDGVRIIVDGNQQWQPKDALAMAEALAPHSPWWLEEPLPAAWCEAYAELRRASPVPIATGETNYGAAELGRLVHERGADILMPNLQRAGGITPWRTIAAACELARIPVASHVYAEVSAHLLCAIPNGLVLEMVPWWPRLFVETLAVNDGVALPPQGPGLGLSLDPDAIARHRV